MDVVFLHKKVAHKVKTKMDSNSLSFRQAATEIGIPYSTLHHIINNNVWPNARHLFLLAGWLREPADLFVDYKNGK